MIHPTLADGESFVEGRSTDTAKELLELAGEDRHGVVITTSHGYIVPSDILPEGYDAVTNADTAAVITQPGTSTNVDEVWNVGGAPKPADKPESSDDKDVDPDVLAALEAEKAAAEAAKQADMEAEADRNAAEARAAIADNVPDADADEADADENPEGLEFDPSAATVDEVKEYLAGADDEERARVLEAEKASAKPRKGVLDLAVITEEGK